MMIGQWQKAAEAYRMRLELGPQTPNTWVLLAFIGLKQGDLDEALRAAERETDFVYRLLALTFVHHAAGNKGQSDAALQSMIDGYSECCAYQIAEAYACRQESDRAFEWLDKACVQRDPGLTQMRSDALLENVRADPRCTLMLRKMKLPD